MTHARRAGRTAPFLAIITLLALPGCAILGGTKPPPSLIRLTAAETVPAGPGAPLTNDRAVTVMIPTAPVEIASLRVPVRSGASALTYLKGAQYADQPTRLFRDLLAETVRARTGRPVLDARDYHLAPGTRLSGRITQFGLDSGTMTVVLTFDAVLQRGTGIDTQRFEARVPVSAATEPAVAAALDQAANQVAVQAAGWVGR